MKWISHYSWIIFYSNWNWKIHRRKGGNILANANIKISANSGQTDTALKELSRQMKILQSDFSLSATKAKLFGSETDQLTAKQQELTAKMKLQENVISLQKQTVEDWKTEISKAKIEQENIRKKIEETTKAYKDSVTATGRNSEESKRLAAELRTLKEEEAKYSVAIDGANKQLDMAQVKLNNSQKALLENKKALKDTNKAIKTAGLDELASNFDKASEKSGKLAGALGKVSLGIGAVFGLASKTAADSETAFSRLQAKLGLTAEETERLKEVGNSVYSQGFGESIDETSNALVSLQKNLDSTKNWSDETRESVLKQVMTISDLFGAENDEITKTVKVMQDSGLTDDVEASLDLITRGFQEGGDYSGELLDTLREYSPQFVKLGLTADEAMNYLITGANNGAFNLDKVGDAMKEFSIRAIDGSKTTDEGFKLLNLNAKEMSTAMAKGGDSAKEAFNKTLQALASIEDPMKQNQAGVDLFGTQWEDLGATTVTALANVKGGLGDVEGATQKATDAMNNNPTAQFNSALRETQTALMPLGTELLNVGTNAAPGFKNVISDITGVLKNLSPTQTEVIIKLGAFFIGATTLAGGISTLTGGVSSAITTINAMRESTVLASAATKTMEIAQGALNLVMSMNPIGLVVIALTVLVGGLVIAYNKCDWFRNMVNDAFTSVANTAKWIFGGIKTFISNWGVEIVAAVNPVIGIPLLIIKHWDTIKGFFSGLKSHVSSMLSSMFSFQLPHIKLPHFSVHNWSANPVDWVTNGRPYLGVDWYAEGGIMTSPTLFGLNGNRAMVGGEAGEEAILPLAKLWDNLGQNFDKLESRLNKNPINVTTAVYLGDNEIIKIAKVMTPEISNQLAKASTRRRG